VLDRDKSLAQRSSKKMVYKKVNFNPTKKELAVLHLLSRGLSNQEIAGVLHVSDKTVASHVGTLLNKTGCNSRFILVLHFIEKGTLKPIGTNSRIQQLESQLLLMEEDRDRAIVQLEEMRTKFKGSIVEILNQLDLYKNAQTSTRESK
jgi:DNA-binding CsgD family transcriptional regulator